jgi:phosphohistidine phosphatase
VPIAARPILARGDDRTRPIKSVKSPRQTTLKYPVAIGLVSMAQMIFLVHHADAVAASVDHLRPLSTVGREQADRVADAARRHGAKPRAIWHSGKQRARETAHAWLRLVNPSASFMAVRGIRPDDDPEIVAESLLAEDADVAIVSHMPLLPMLLHRLTTGQRDRMSAPFPNNGCVALEREGDLWVERWRVGS